MQAQKVETDSLERRDAFGEVRRCRLLPGSQNVGVRRSGRGEGGDRLGLRARLGGAGLERRDDRRQLGELLPVFRRQRREQIPAWYVSSIK